MQLYDATNKQGICQEIDGLCDTTDTTYSRERKTSRINQALEEVVGWILNADGTWQFDDRNYSTLPIGVGTLVEGQTSYSFADKFLDIEEVDILDLNGIYKRVIPFDPDELGMSFEEYFGITTSTTPTGFPLYYDKVGDSIKLAPAPSSSYCTLTNGLKVRFSRTGYLFTVASDTTADTTEPGFVSTYHPILAYMASIPYCMTYKPERVAAYAAKVGQMKKDMLDFYSRREKDKRHVMTPKREPYL